MTNEKRLIDANALRTDTMAMCGVNEAVLEKCYPYWQFNKAIVNAPTVDAVELVHGRWVLLAEFLDGSIFTECSVCGEEYTYKKGRLELVGFEYAKYNYCPNCGAKMDGDKHE